MMEPVIHTPSSPTKVEIESKRDSGQAINRRFGTGWSSVFHWHIALTSIFLFIGSGYAGFITGVKPQEYKIPVGEDVLLSCPVARKECGPLHSIKWYKDEERVFMYSELISMARPEGSLLGRAELASLKNDTTSDLKIFQLTANDSALYKCDITYLEVREKCTTVHFSDLVVLVKPDFIRVTLPGSYEVKNNSLIGPYLEGASLSLSCESGPGRPIPDVSWWNGAQFLDNSSSTYTSAYNAQGIGTGRNELSYVLTRADIGSRFECRATSEALPLAWTSAVEVEVYVAPTYIQLTGLTNSVDEGKMVTLTCEVDGSRPPANITWFNGTEPIKQPPTSSSAVQPSGAYRTLSQLNFPASRFDNDIEISCEANNEVLAAKLEPPMRASVKLDVLYPPVVRVSPENITVNDSADVFIVCSYQANPPNVTRVLWYKDEREIFLDPDKFSGGYPEIPSLLIKNVNRSDEGSYSCYVENEVGISESENQAKINVFYPPEVVLVIDPDYPIRETDNVNITLNCNVVAGYPTHLEKVKWFFRDILIKELPDCGRNQTPSDKNCDQDPSKLKLERVTGSFAGNYSCRGKNGAGWSNMSEPSTLVVYYPPSIGFLTHSPSKVVKGQSVTLSCEIYDFGFPDEIQYNWYKNDHLITGVSAANWTIDPVSLKTEAKFSCAGYNLAGEGPRASVQLTVIAPPTFIERLPPYLGALVDASEVSISCRVECVPICGVEWLKNGQLVISSRHYSIKSTTLPKDPMTNDMDSLVSTLSWNLATLPEGRLDRHRDNANYTCRSSGNGVGPGVSSTTYFRVEYPPENISISDSIVRVVEGDKPSIVTCSASAFPEATYLWKFGDQTILTGENLDLDFEITRSRSGEYDCIAQNRHGEATIKTYLDILYKPECTISQQEVDDVIQLVCNVIANPREVDFVWVVDNATVLHNIETSGLQSVMTLSSSTQRFGTYKCYANNSVGVLDRPCEIDIQDVGIWLAGGDMIILIVVILVSLLLILLIIIIVCCLRKKKKSGNKFNSSVELEERENPEGNSNTSNSQAQPVHKWPLRPGVHVHLNGLYDPNQNGNLRSSLSSITGGESKSGSQDDSTGDSSGEDLLSSPNTFPNNVKQHSTKADLDKTDRVVGMLNNPESPPDQRPHQKDPNKDPTSSSNMGEINELGIPPADAKSFYENLPFHGLQTPPNKPNNSDPPMQSRPPSQLSQNASSGYGSTRSQSGLAVCHFGSLRSQRSQQSPEDSMRSHSSVIFTKTLGRDRAKDKNVTFGRPISVQFPNIPPSSHSVHEQNNNSTVPTSHSPEEEAGVPVPAPRIPKDKPTYLNIPQGASRRNIAVNLEMNIKSPLILGIPQVHPHHSHPPPYNQFAKPYYASHSKQKNNTSGMFPSDNIVYADLSLPSRKCKDGSQSRLSTEYAVLQFAGVSPEIDV